MKKQKSGYWNDILWNRKELLIHLVGGFIIGIFIMIIISDTIYSENLRLHNENADLWCKSQSYEKIIEPEKQTDICLKNRTFERNYKLIVVLDKNGYPIYINGFKCFDSEEEYTDNEYKKKMCQTIMFNMKKNFKIEKEYAWANVTIKDFSDFFTRCSEYKTIPAKTEIHKYETGRWLENENKIVCYNSDSTQGSESNLGGTYAQKGVDLTQVIISKYAQKGVDLTPAVNAKYGRDYMFRGEVV